MIKTTKRIAEQYDKDKTKTLLIYADFVRSSNKVESKLNHLLKLAKEQNINYIRTS